MNGFQTIVAALALVAGVALAGTTLNTIGGTLYVRDAQGNTTSYQKVGSTIVGSDGSTIKTVVNTSYFNDGHGNITKCNVVGSTTYCN